jgi:zinc protease
LPKKTRGQSVNVRLTLRYGNEQNLQGLPKAAELLPTLMLRGTKQLTRQQLQDRLDEHRAQLHATGTPGEATFSIETKRDQLPKVLDLLRQVLREPALPDSELEILRQAHISSQEQRLTDPQALATTTVRRKLFPYPKGDPRYVPTVAEEIELLKALKPADVRKLYEGYLNGEAGELAVVGDFDPKEILPLFSEMLDDWKATAAYERLKVSGDVKLKAETETILTPDKANATYFAATVFPVSDAHPDFAALEMGNYIFGGGSLSSRLGDRVRQQEGLSYGVGSGFNARPLDERAALYIYAICNPTNMEKVKAAIREELDKLLAKGVTEEELAAAVKGYLENKALERAEDAQLAAVLTNLAFAGRTMQYYTDLEAKIAKLAVADVQAALRKHVDPKRIVIVAAGDFEKKPAGQ